MLKKINRLPKGSFKGNILISSPFYLLKIAKNGKPFSRFGFVVSKKVSKKAVERNRIKRELRSFIHERLPKTVSGFDFLFISKKPIEDNKDLENDLKKEGIMK